MAFDVNGQAYFTFEELSFDAMCADLDKRNAFHKEKLESNTTATGKIKSFNRYNRLLDYRIAIMRRTLILNSNIFGDLV